MIRLALALLLLPLGALAQPAMDPLGPSILDTGSGVVDTHSFTLPGPDGAMDYRIGVLTPRRAPPAAGFPVLFALDGQAVAELLSDATLSRIDAPLPVIVTLGYDTDMRFAALARTRDYTPPGDEGGAVRDPRGRPGGGAPAFLDLLQDAVVPRVAAIAPIDMTRSTLWGHSYGGLFALYAAGAPASPFARVVAASPSLWWDDAGYLARVRARIDAGDWPQRPIDLHVGALERERASRPANPNAQKLVKMRAALPEDALQDLAQTLRGAGIPGALHVFAGLSHGETFGASIENLLETGFSATERD